MPGRLTVVGRLPSRAASPAVQGQRPSASPAYVHPEIEFFLLKPGEGRRLGADTCGQRRLLRPGRATTAAPNFRRPTPSTRWSRWASRWSFSHHEGCAPASRRDRPALRAEPRLSNGRQRDDVSATWSRRWRWATGVRRVVQCRSRSLSIPARPCTPHMKPVRGREQRVPQPR